MPAYIFRPYLSGGTRLAFEVDQFQDDASALMNAELVFLAHPRCIGVTVYQGERSVGAYLGSSGAPRELTGSQG